MKHSVQYTLQGTDDRFEYLSQSFLEIVNQILVTQEDIAAKINGLDCANPLDSVINKDVANILADIQVSKDLIKELRDFTGYKEP